MGFRRNLLQLESYPDAIFSDLRTLAEASRNLGVHSVNYIAASSGHFGFLRWLATIAAIYLIVVDRTRWKTDLLTGLLAPYIWLNFPPILFNFFRGEVGKWIALVGIIVKLFFPRRFPDEAELPLGLLMLLVAAPNFLAVDFRLSVFGLIVSLLIGAYLLTQHIRNAGGFRNAFAAQHGIPNTIGILLLFISPTYEIIRHYIL